MRKMTKILIASVAILITMTISVDRANADVPFGTFCVDRPNVDNTGFCTLLDVQDTGHQICQDSMTMQTCDGEG